MSEKKVLKDLDIFLKNNPDLDQNIVLNSLDKISRAEEVNESEINKLENAGFFDFFDNKNLRGGLGS